MSPRTPVILLTVLLAACGAAPSAQAAVTGGLSGGTLTLSGDGADDTIRVLQDPSAPSSVSFLPRPASPVAGCVEAPTGGGDGMRCDGVTAIVVDGGGGEDRLDAEGVFAVPVTLRGADGDDVLLGGTAADDLDGGADDDTVFSRDGLAEDVDCGPGADRVRSDTKQERIVACEVVAPQVFGELRLVGTPQVGQQLTMAGVEVLGTPAPTVTFTWRRCSTTAPSSCSVIGADPALLLTELDAESGVVVRGTARYSNGFGVDEAEAGPVGPILPAPLVAPLAEPPPAPPSGAGPVVPFDGRAAAARAMGGAAVPIPRWRSTAIAAVRPRGAVPLSRRGDRRVAAFACAVARCEVRLRPRLRAGRRTITLSPVRVRMAAGEARYVTVWLTSSARRAVLRARTARLIVSVTADPAAGVPRSFTVAVR